MKRDAESWTWDYKLLRISRNLREDIQKHSKPKEQRFSKRLLQIYPAKCVNPRSMLPDTITTMPVTGHQLLLTCASGSDRLLQVNCTDKRSYFPLDFFFWAKDQEENYIKGEQISYECIDKLISLQCDSLCEDGTVVSRN